MWRGHFLEPVISVLIKEVSLGSKNVLKIFAFSGSPHLPRVSTVMIKRFLLQII